MEAVEEKEALNICWTICVKVWHNKSSTKYPDSFILPFLGQDHENRWYRQQEYQLYQFSKINNVYIETHSRKIYLEDEFPILVLLCIVTFALFLNYCWIDLFHFLCINLRLSQANQALAECLATVSINMQILQHPQQHSWGVLLGCQD